METTTTTKMTRTTITTMKTNFITKRTNENGNNKQNVIYNKNKIQKDDNKTKIKNYRMTVMTIIRISIR